MLIAHLHQRLRLYTIEWMNLNVVVHPHVSTSFGTSKAITYIVEAITSEIIDKVHDCIVLTDRRIKVPTNAWACWGHRDITWHSEFCEKLDMKKLSARWVPRLLAVDKRDRMTISKQCLDMFQSRWISASIHYCRRNMDHTRNEGIVKTIDFTGWTNSEEGENRKIGRKGNGHSFMGMHAV